MGADLNHGYIKVATNVGEGITPLHMFIEHKFLILRNEGMWLARSLTMGKGAGQVDVSLTI